MLERTLQKPADSGAEHRPHIFWASILIGVAAVLAVANYYVLVRLKENVIANEEQVLLRLADSIATSIENVVNVTVLALENADAAILKQGLRPEEIHNTLKVMTASLPFLRMAGIVDANGKLIHSTNSYPPPDIDLGYRDYVSYYLDGGQAKYYISALNLNAFDRKWQVTLSRPVRGADGTLRAVQVASIDTRYLYSELMSESQAPRGDGADRLYRNYSISLLDKDMRLVARTPWVEGDLGRSLAKTELYQALVGAGTADTTGIFTSPFTGDRRVGAAAWLAGKRFVISVSTPLKPVLAYWRTSAAVTAGSSALLFAGLVLAWLRTMRHQRALRRHASHLAAMNVELEKQTMLGEESVKAKSAFLANMSHEIRTPLNGIIGYSGLALEDETLSEATRRHLKLVFSASNSLRVIIDDILDISAIEAGKVYLASLPFSVAETIENCQSIVEPSAKAKGLQVRTQLDPRIPAWTVGDAVRLQQVLLNLIYNAIKFSEKGVVEIAVTCTGTVDDKVLLRFSVRDEGIGIAKDNLESLFERFWQVDDSFSRRYGGSGLGLAICKTLVALMGGEIGVESLLGRGSTFWFTLPLAVASGPELSAAGAAPGPTRSPLKILVVDDVAMNCELAKTLLERAGHVVTMACDGAFAVNACAKEKYDLVFMDVQMPGIDGLEATRQIRALNEHASKMPIIAMTANVMPDQIALYRAAGMNDCLGKPIDRNRLFAMLARWMTGSDPKGAEPGQVARVAIHDRSMLDTVREVLGPQRTRAYLEKLSATLTDEVWDACPERTRLIKAAHVTVSLAGQLGFSEVSAAARELETASLGNGDFDQALAAFHAARMQAATVLDGLIAEQPEPEQRAAAAAM